MSQAETPSETDTSSANSKFELRFEKFKVGALWLFTKDGGRDAQSSTQSYNT